MHGTRQSTNVLFLTAKVSRFINIIIRYIPINDTPFEPSVFWPSDKESRSKELMFSDSLSFKKSYVCFLLLRRHNVK